MRVKDFLKEHPGNDKRSWKSTGVVKKVVDSRQVSEKQVDGPRPSRDGPKLPSTEVNVQSDLFYGGSRSYGMAATAHR